MWKTVRPFGLAIAGVVMLALAGSAKAAPVYFLVTEFPGQEMHHDSFVVPIEEPADIAHARDLVRRGPKAGATQVGADIVAGADNINRNILAGGKPAWSWHISKFDGFADISIELTDGWPGYIEQDVAGWIDNTDGTGIGVPGNGTGRISFWGYTVTAELTGPANDLRPLPATVIPLPAALPAGMLLLAAGGFAFRKMR
jgi:hypothetical protein